MKVKLTTGQTSRGDNGVSVCLLTFECDGVPRYSLDRKGLQSSEVFNSIVRLAELVSFVASCKVQAPRRSNTNHNVQFE